MIVKGVYSTLLNKFFEDPEEAVAAENSEKSKLMRDLEVARNKLESIRSCYNKSKLDLSTEYETRVEVLRKKYEPAIEELVETIAKISTNLQK